MTDPYRTIMIEPEAPNKPPTGAACNGCGVCCLVEPCPIGVVLSRRRRGACVALRWEYTARQYRCGAMSDPGEVLLRQWPGIWEPLRKALAALLKKSAPRWIAAGQGCDSTLETARPSGTIPFQNQDSETP
nr:hypothetical protein [Rhodoferax sp.]